MKIYPGDLISVKTNLERQIWEDNSDRYNPVGQLPNNEIFQALVIAVDSSREVDHFLLLSFNVIGWIHLYEYEIVKIER